jgi:Protein of unknown function (DUF3617)
MRISASLLIAGTALIVLTGGALADHGKAGLWAVKSTTTMQGMPPHSFNSTQCMTEAEAKAQTPPNMNNTGNCKMANQQMTANSYTADMVCNGEAKGTGHITVTYDGAAHYSGQMTMSMSMGGQAMSTTNTFEGKWVSPDCGKSTH